MKHVSVVLAAIDETPVALIVLSTGLILTFGRLFQFAVGLLEPGVAQALGPLAVLAIGYLLMLTRQPSEDKNTQ